MDELYLDNPPKTVKDAVEMIITIWSPKALKDLASKSKADLWLCHFGIGLWIRNNFGLWEGNKALMRDAGSNIQDDVSMIIIEALRKKLREKQNERTRETKR